MNKAVIEKTGHPAYTVDPAEACEATSWGGNHTCHCVYRRTVCDGINHLCLCGNDWRDMTGAYSRCYCNHERNIHMATPVGIEITAHQGEFRLTVSMEADVITGASTVQREQLRRATRAMMALLDTSEPSADDEDEDEEDRY